MSKALQSKIDELFEATKDLMSLEEIKPHCDRFNEWVNGQRLSEKSLGTQLSRYGFYSKFCSIPLEQGKNAESVSKHDKEGKVKGRELKHYVVLRCGLTKDQWEGRNATTRSTDRIDKSNEDPKVIDPETYLAVVSKLLESNDPHELAVGIIAATGRRPAEVLARGKLAAIEGKPFHAMFSGQVKKRGADLGAFEIATLFPAKSVIAAWAKLRRDEGIKNLLKEVAIAYPGSITRQNVEINNRRNGSLLRIVREYFGDKGDKTPILPFRHGDEQDNSKALRAAYATLATERDCKGGSGAKILHASRLLGHMIREKKDDSNLIALGTSIGYMDYSVSKPVPFPELPKKERSTPVRAGQSDAQMLKSLQLFWHLPNQQAVISRLIERHEKTVELGRQLQEMSSKLSQTQAKLREAEAEINKLEKEKQEMLQVELTSEVEAAIERVVTEKVQKALANAHQSEVRPVETTVTKQPEVIDWESKSNAEVWGTKMQGAASEKIRRAFNAICLYNDTLATGNDDRLAVTNQGLRTLTGVNGQQITEWLREHEDELVTHHMKYGMQPLDSAGNPAMKDGRVRVDSYYNKRHKQEKVGKLMALVNEKFLEGVARS